LGRERKREREGEGGRREEKDKDKKSGAVRNATYCKVREKSKRLLL
jgi:hypothetical protein